MEDITKIREFALNLHYEKVLKMIGEKIGLDPFIDVVLTGYSLKLMEYLVKQFNNNGFTAYNHYLSDGRPHLYIDLAKFELESN